MIYRQWPLQIVLRFELSLKMRKMNGAFYDSLVTLTNKFIKTIITKRSILISRWQANGIAIIPVKSYNVVVSKLPRVVTDAHDLKYSEIRWHKNLVLLCVDSKLIEPFFYVKRPTVVKEFIGLAILLQSVYTGWFIHFWTL